MKFDRRFMMSMTELLIPGLKPQVIQTGQQPEWPGEQHRLPQIFCRFILSITVSKENITLILWLMVKLQQAFYAQKILLSKKMNNSRF